MRYPPRGITLGLTPREKIKNSKWCPVPGWVGDPLPKIGKFDRWYKRPKSSHRLYWRTHKEAYAQMSRGENHN